MIDLTISTEKPTSLAEIISAFRVAAKSDMAGVLKVTDEELVSTDYNGSSYSAIIDAPACAELNPQVCVSQCSEKMDTDDCSSSKSWLGTTMSGDTRIVCWI